MFNHEHRVFSDFHRQSFWNEIQHTTFLFRFNSKEDLRLSMNHMLIFKTCPLLQGNLRAAMVLKLSDHLEGSYLFVFAFF